MQVSGVCERPPVCLLQKTFQHHTELQPTPAAPTKGPEAGIRKRDLAYRENYIHFPRLCTRARVGNYIINYKGAVVRRHANTEAHTPGLLRQCHCTCI